MKKIVILSLVAAALSACSNSGIPVVGAIDYGPDVRPIRGSLTYGDQPVRRPGLPPGTRFSHNFYDQFGNRVEERYRVREDGSLELFSRRASPVKFRS